MVRNALHPVMSQIWAERMRPTDAGVSRRSLVVIQQVTEPWI
jgi:hypothetical protein